MHNVYYHNFLSFYPSACAFVCLSLFKTIQNSVIDQAD
jgi:hypothetical protein